MTISQKDLARALGVSQYTVSVALGGKGRVSDKLRKRVLDKAEEMGYQANPLAAGLRGGKTSTIAVIWQFIDPWTGDGLVALDLLDRLEKRGYRLLQAQQREDPQIMVRQIDDFLARRVDALIVFGTPDQLMYPEVQQRLNSNLPVVAVSREDIPSFCGDLVIHDRCRAIREVVAYFAKTGRKRVSFAIASAQEANPHKIAAYNRACIEFGLEEHEKLLLDLDYPNVPEETGIRHARAVERYFANGCDVDAIFAFNDVGAMHIIHALRERGVHVPEDVAVVGFNNIPSAPIWQPPLASGDRKRLEVAAAVESLLMRRMDEPGQPPQRATVHMEFIWRESAGPRIN